MTKTIESCATTDGKMVCELMVGKHYGATVYVVHVYETSDYVDYKETHRSYPMGNKVKAKTLYKKYTNIYLRNRK